MYMGVMCTSGCRQMEHGIIERTELEHSDDVSIRDDGDYGVWLYVGGEPVKHLTPMRLREQFLGE
jgi:hypothetical protein